MRGMLTASALPTPARTTSTTDHTALLRRKKEPLPDQLPSQTLDWLQSRGLPQQELAVRGTLFVQSYMHARTGVQANGLQMQQSRYSFHKFTAHIFMRYCSLYYVHTNLLQSIKFMIHQRRPDRGVPPCRCGRAGPRPCGYTAHSSR